MVKKYSVLLAIIISMLLLLIATAYYPGGSQADKNSIGFNWKHNYISNLFAEKAVNGAHNTARFWAIGGMFFLSAGFAIFFVEFSKRIPAKGAASVIRYAGAGGMLFTFLIATPLHDTMVTISATLFLLGMFYCTVFIFQTKLHMFKILCVVYLLFFYALMYVYGSGYYREFLPVLQKIIFVSTIMLVLALAYFTKTEDFESLKKGK